MTPFEEWLENSYPLGPMLQWPRTPNSEIREFMKEAYEAGWNACRDKWGGLEYNDPFNKE
jgi:hypothetical protein